MHNHDQAAAYPQHIATLRQRHDAVLADAPYDAIVVHSGEQRPTFLDDYHYPYKANPHFKAWLPLTDNPQCWIVHRAGEQPRMIYFQPEDYWHIPPSPPSGYWVEQFEIVTITDPEQARQHFPSNLSATAFIGENEALAQSIGFGGINDESIINPLHWGRSEKTDYEIACIAQANRIAASAHRAAERAFREGGSEFDIQQAYLRDCRQSDNELPYGNIVALNEHGATLHYQHLDRTTPAQHHAFLIDAGVNVNGYASDITRTYAFDTDNEFQALINAMDQKQQAMGNSARAGASYPEMHLGAHQAVGDLLSEFGFVSMSGEDIVTSGVSKTFLPHGLGHFLGAQVHDVAGFQRDPSGGVIDRPDGHPYLRLTRELAPRHVLTIEPGLYFIDPLLAELRANGHADAVNWDKIDQFRKFGGVRIEDDIVVTDGDPINLTRNAFAGLA